MPVKNTLHQLLHQFGLSPKEREIYLLLKKSGFITVLKLSNRTKIKRSTIYRVIESLENKGLVEKKIEENTTYFGATAFKNFQNIIFQQEKNLSQMKTSYQKLQSQLSLLNNIPNKETEVHFYRGVNGLQSMEWKMIEPKIETYILGNTKWHSVLGEKFAEEVRQERVDQRVVVKEILNPEYREIIPISGQVKWTKNQRYVLKHYQHRYIANDIISITNEIMINPQAFYMFSFQEYELIGIEIINLAYAQMMSSFFRILWNQAEIVDQFGGNKL